MTQQAHGLPQTDIGARERASKAQCLPGTVAIEEPVELAPFETGKSAKGYVARVPIEVNTDTLSRGKERFNIYCSGCHDRAGTGQGIVVQRGFPGPIELASNNTRRMTDGEIFSIITQGVRNMPPMAEQIPVSDRWPIVVWVRVLQRSQHALFAELQAIHPSGILTQESEP
jgi:mono/diheme cytochrome c family protein